MRGNHLGRGSGTACPPVYKPAEVSALIQFLIRPWVDVRLGTTFRYRAKRDRLPHQSMSRMTHIAVVDVETTGINPYHHNRIVELAVLVMQPDGTVVRTFATLVNPERDIGPTSIHGLTAGIS